MGNRLCSACEGITVERLVAPEGYPHHHTIADWIDLAAWCRLCSLMFEQIDEKTSRYQPDRIRTGTAFKAGGPVVKDKPLQYTHGLRLTWNRDTSLCNLSAYPITVPSDLPGFSVSAFSVTNVEIYTDNEDMADMHSIPWRRKLPHNTGHDSSIKVAQFWLSQCLGSHKGFH
jgi:hypothetical protein